MLLQKRRVRCPCDPHDESLRALFAHPSDHRLAGNDVAQVLDQEDSINRTARVLCSELSNREDDCPRLALRSPEGETRLEPLAQIVERSPKWNESFQRANTGHRPVPYCRSIQRR